jgi:NADPH:quinone reductase-like Zn-dependent oxidoreductase
MIMRAAVYYKYGPPEVTSIADVPKPVPGPEEVLVEVRAAGLNRTDTGFRSGKPFFARYFTGLRRPKHSILGAEVSGVVTHIGGNVTKFAVGNRVFGVHAIKFGTHAEYVCMKETAPLAKMPDNMSFVEGAGVCDGMILAVNYTRRVNLGPAHRILIYGSSGAIGTAAVQLAKHAGAHVTAVCTTKNLELMKTLGADEVIDYTTTDFTKAGQTYDFVFDAVGKHSYRRCRRVLVKRGAYMSTDLGFMWQNPLLALATRWLPVRKLYFPIPPYRQADVELLAKMFEAGDYRAVIDRTYPLDDVVDAMTYVESQQKTGNVVLIIRPD